MADGEPLEHPGRPQVIARALEGVLADGEEWLVRRYEDDIEVIDAVVSRLRGKHPKLYGELLALHERVGQAAGDLMMLMLLATGIFCLGVYLEWWDELFDRSFEKFRSIWFYALAMVTSFIVSGVVSSWWERRTYRRSRGLLQDAIKEAGLTKPELLALIQDDLEVAKAAQQLKMDLT